MRISESFELNWRIIESKPTYLARLLMASWQNRVEDLNRALAEQVPTQLELNEALEWAVTYGQTESVRVLLDNGANPTIGMSRIGPMLLVIFSHIAINYSIDPIYANMRQASYPLSAPVDHKNLEYIKILFALFEAGAEIPSSEQKTFVAFVSLLKSVDFNDKIKIEHHQLKQACDRLISEAIAVELTGGS